MESSSFIIRVIIVLLSVIPIEKEGDGDMERQPSVDRSQMVLVGWGGGFTPYLTDSVNKEMLFLRCFPLVSSYTYHIQAVCSTLIILLVLFMSLFEGQSESYGAVVGHP